ncbi:SPFH domain-containing protein [Planctomycetota bacterium]
MTISSKRAEYIAWISLILCVIFYFVTLLIGRWSGFYAVYAVSWLIFSAGLIWLVLLIQFHQRALAEREKLDTSQMQKDDGSSAIFQAKGEQSTLFAVARRRLQLLEKWFLPFFSAAIGIYQAVLGFYLLKAVPDSVLETKQPLLCAICMTAIAFVSFLFSRYATGMSGQLKWKPLRAGGSITLAVSVVCFGLAVALAFAEFGYPLGVTIFSYLIPILLMLLGIETALNVILNIYRPRIKGRYSRAAFDSRLLGIINEPGEILHTAAGAIDYQFGFKVSQTWFYKLLEKAILPLILFAVCVLYFLSSVVVIASDEEAIVEHFGNPKDKDGEVRILEPGIHFKYPWPINTVHRHPTKKVSEISVGFIPKKDPSFKIGYGPLLWGKAHHGEEYNLLVASQQTGATTAEGAVPVSFVMAAVPVQYRVKNLYDFLYKHTEPEKILEAICYQELTKFAASATIEVDTESQLEHSLLGAGRSEAKEVLTTNVQQKADEAGLGVEVIFLGLQEIHPPPEVAEDYQKVIGAVQQRQALILNAEAERNYDLSTLAGSVEQADNLYELAAKYQLSKDNNQTERAENFAEQLDSAFQDAQGDIFKTLRQAQSYSFEKATLAQATGLRFEGQLKAYRAAPEIYKHQERALFYEESYTDIRKFIIASDPEHKQNFIIDMQEKLTPDLYDITGIEEPGQK